ncbi:unnamed protein product [Mycena citricolor]|uniref:Uncharacterized protein n=1 Tax=Mycena citricolor TaxID=2018698 RepID=A0AAD2HKM3_9AGAR|nr:unnamed protein product [Mycena citricolor]
MTRRKRMRDNLREVKLYDEERRIEREREERAEPDTAHFDDPRRDRRHLLLPDLDEDKRDDQQPKQDKQRDDASVAPRILRPSPLQREQQTHDRRHEQQRPERIKVVDLLQQRQLGVGGFGFSGDVQEDEEEEQADAADGQVNLDTQAVRTRQTGTVARISSRRSTCGCDVISSPVKRKNGRRRRAGHAPSPRNLVRKHAAHEGPRNARNPVHAPNQPRIHRPFLERHGVRCVMHHREREQTDGVSPAIARPMINAVELGAPPQIALPTSNTTIAATKTWP